MIKYNIFDKPFFDDLEPEEKSEEELTLLILKTAAGEPILIKKYNQQEINRCARKLIEKELIRGTVLGQDLCSWSRLTMKGRMYFKLKLKYSTYD